MRPGPTTEALAGSVGWQPLVSAWKGLRIVAYEVPVTGGNVTATASQNVPERLSLTVPRYSTVDGRRFDWMPGDDPLHPLARYGQYLVVQIRVTSSLISSRSWTTKIGTYRIQSWAEQADGSIQVDAVGFLQLIDDDLLWTPMAPLPGGTLVTEFRRLLPLGFVLAVDPGLRDRPCPRSLSWADNRLSAFYSIVDAWPARLRTSEDGWRLKLLPPLPTTPGAPVFALADGVRGVVVYAPSSDTRDNGFNRIIARSSAATTPQSTLVQSIANQPAGPMDPYPSDGYRAVTKIISTPLLSDESSLQLMGRTGVANNLRPVKKVSVTMAPDPRVDLDDVASVAYRGRTITGWVIGYDLPLRPQVTGSPMRVDVAVST